MNRHQFEDDQLENVCTQLELSRDNILIRQTIKD